VNELFSEIPNGKQPMSKNAQYVFYNNRAYDVNDFRTWGPRLNIDEDAWNEYAEPVET
jgi:hypothetical protein